MAGPECLIIGIVMFIILVCIALPVGFFCSGLYVFFSVFESCCDCGEILSILHKGLEWPRNCAKNMMAGRFQIC